MTTLKPSSIRTLTMAHPIILGMMCLGLLLPFQAGAITSATNPAALPLRAMPAPPNLDNQRLFALGMIETGNDDRAIGRAGEISRYQLSPSVWKNYSKSLDYQNPSVSVWVVRQHWIYLAAYFQEKTGHAPDDYDMYVLWNTRYGYYAHKGFSRQHISPIVQDRAQRFVNLVNRKD